MTEQSNAPDPVVVKQLVGDVLRVKDEILSENGVHASRIKAKREIINGLRDRAKDAGLPHKVFDAAIKHIELERKIKGLTEDMDGDAEDLYEYMMEQLGDFADTPLGAAAVNEATKAGGKKSAEDKAWDEADPNAKPSDGKKGGRGRKKTNNEALNGLAAGDDVAANRVRAEQEHQAALNEQRLKDGIKPLDTAAPEGATVK